MITYTALLVLTYLAGSVNFAIVLFHVTGRGDPRRRFSGNPGATNIYRQAGAVWAAAVLILDMGRASLLALTGAYLLPPAYQPGVGLVLIAANRWPCWHRFKGGKGVANYMGFTLFLVPLFVLAGAIVWGAVYYVWRRPFLASFAMVAILAAGAVSHFPSTPLPVCTTLATAGLIYFNHRQNITELIAQRRGKS